MIDAITSYPNVHIRNLDLIRYAEGTPAEEWIKEGKMYDSIYMLNQVSNFIRLISLFKWGGTYLDLDIVMLKNISLLGENFAGAETGTYVNNAVLNMNRRTEIGHRVAEMCLVHFIENYLPDFWGINGPLLVTKVMEEICGTATGDTSKMTWEQCNGFHVYDPSYFYALNYDYFQDAFDEDPLKFENVMQLYKDSTLAHLWNYVSSGYPVKVGSRVAYGVLADLHCPEVYHSLDFDDIF